MIGRWRWSQEHEFNSSRVLGSGEIQYSGHRTALLNLLSDLLAMKRAINNFQSKNIIGLFLPYQQTLVLHMWFSFYNEI